MKIDALAMAEGPAIYYDDKFRAVLEDHLTYLRNHPKTTTVTVSPVDAFKYEGDYYGLLTTLNIPYHFHWLIMRLNGHRSPFSGNEKETQVIVPAESVIEQIRQSHNAKRKIS